MEMTSEGASRLPHFIQFGKHLIGSKDIDPVYPVLRRLERGLTEEQKLWMSFLYVGWYHLPVAAEVFDLFPEPNRDLLNYINPKFPTGIERRAHRGGNITKHLEDFFSKIESAGGIKWYFTNGLYHDDHRQNWMVMNERLQQIHGNGRWAAYKHCEILRRVHHLPLEAPDMGNRFSSGPREGLATLYGPLEGQGDAVILTLDKQGLDLQRRLKKQGLAVDIEQLETILCNWKSLVKGKYYVGHDIDEMQEQIRRYPFVNKATSRQLFSARKMALPRHYLGELNGWEGIDKQRMAAYRDRNKIVIRKKRST